MESMEDLGYGPCPKCGGKVDYYGSCHTYGDESGWFACLGCYTACQFDCASGDDGLGCGWSYTWGLNPRNPRAARNEENRPAWLEGDFQC